ncbi:hypothetical protein P4O66_008221 [Electrophorus voltai]|uniref:Uncharacterized protein n=1 Tax=Electrophorus voltai TaxID=2609070 RepID=A0AAD8ZH05_9TELE|nr:hypothetical protein P4O66_008221 [Electrophorus voltai]
MSCGLKRIVNSAYMLSRPLAGLDAFYNLVLYTLSGDKFQQAFCSLEQIAIAIVGRKKTKGKDEEEVNTIPPPLRAFVMA